MSVEHSLGIWGPMTSWVLAGSTNTWPLEKARVPKEKQRNHEFQRTERKTSMLAEWETNRCLHFPPSPSAPLTVTGSQFDNVGVKQVNIWTQPAIFFLSFRTCPFALWQNKQCLWHLRVGMNLANRTVWCGPFGRVVYLPRDVYGNWQASVRLYWQPGGNMPEKGDNFRCVWLLEISSVCCLLMITSMLWGELWQQHPERLAGRFNLNIAYKIKA